jgi:hypothetical protein
VKNEEGLDPCPGYRFVRVVSPFDLIIAQAIVVIVQIPHLRRGPVQPDLVLIVAIPVAGYRYIGDVSP